MAVEVGLQQRSDVIDYIDYINTVDLRRMQQSIIHMHKTLNETTTSKNQIPTTLTITTAQPLYVSISKENISNLNVTTQDFKLSFQLLLIWVCDIGMMHMIRLAQVLL